MAPPRAQLSLEQSGGQTLLHIRTPYAMHDPIAQFSLVSDCEAHQQRDYVVLLDPPALVSARSGEAPAATRPDAAALAATPPPTPRTPTPPQRARPHPAHPPAPAARRQSPVAARAPTAESLATPRLVLSGKHSTGATALALRLDTNLPDMSRPHPDKLSTDELSDENTALTRKLAYLEAQLIALQQRNAAFESKPANLPATPPRPAGLPAQWPVYLMIIGLLAGTGSYFWLRRRPKQETPAADGLTPAAHALDPGEISADPWAQPQLPQTDSTPLAARPHEYVPPVVQTTEVNDNILDQAEVYMAHGHGDLAIHLLQEHLSASPDESPVPWLLLLDLLHREGDLTGHTAACSECRRYFNINLSSHPVSQSGETGQGLEAYPHVVQQLTTEWATPTIHDFFNELIFDKRGSTRLGFEPGAYHDILLLRTIAQDIQPLAG